MKRASDAVHTPDAAAIFQQIDRLAVNLHSLADALDVSLSDIPNLPRAN